MRLYFAYGSNMSRARLQARVGAVEVLGWSTLEGHRHAFNKRGNDGSAKGNIVRASSALVHGVLYRLSLDQLGELARYEGGYRMIERRVLLQGPAELHASVTFQALAEMSGLSPRDEYLAHYAAGMREHGLPDDYIAHVLDSAR